MQHSMVECRQQVQDTWQEALAWVKAGEAETLFELEKGLWTRMLAVGRALIGLFLAQRAARPRSVTYEHEGRRYRLEGTRSSTLNTRFGKVQFSRPVGRPWSRSRRAGGCDLPVDRELGLCGGFSLGTVTSVVRLCAMMSFCQARATFSYFHQWSPSPRAVARMVDAAGEQARPFLEQAPAPQDDGEVLVISVDGKGAPMISSKEHARRARPHGSRKANRRHARRAKRRARPRVRRGPGNRSKNAKMATVGVLYTLKRGEDGRLDGPVNKRLYATFDTARSLFQWLQAEAYKRGYGTAKFSKVLFIADGANALWSLQKEFFPDAQVCLDWFHAVEKLWMAGKAVSRGVRRERKKLEAWVAEQKKRLRKGQLQKVLDELRAALKATPLTGPGNKFRRETLEGVLKHFEKNVHRMRYARLRRQDLDISSGAVEGAVRHLVGVRLDGPGMRWGLDRAQSVLHLRCVFINGLWDDFERFLASRQLQLAPQPVSTRTHDAVVKKAA